MFTVKCDKCGKEASFEPLYRREGDLELIFLKCPECGTEYLAAVTDSELRRNIETYERMVRTIRTEKVTELFIEDTRQLYRENLERGRMLLNQYAGTAES